MTAERFLQNVEEELGNLLLGLGHSERLQSRSVVGHSRKWGSRRKRRW